MSVFEIKRTADGWDYVSDSDYNRRITAYTEMQLTACRGP
nr:alkaline phosphatase PhoX [Aliamphritea spongicola]